MCQQNKTVIASGMASQRLTCKNTLQHVCNDAWKGTPISHTQKRDWFYGRNTQVPWMSINGHKHVQHRGSQGMRKRMHAHYTQQRQRSEHVPSQVQKDITLPYSWWSGLVGARLAEVKGLCKQTQASKRLLNDDTSVCLCNWKPYLRQ